ncbi:nucleotidyltransferase family protein (plasmid) [Azospirillum sp. A26]|uniref:nucleotidyltransferase family protein n=1 Tax=Azospirillum sp. A26 TaxID=3160607 RepID=UPI00366AF167
MRALLLAAGFGTRLRPLTDTVPKCLVPIGDRSLLDLWLDLLFTSGIERVLVNTHHHAETVCRHLAASCWSNRIDWVHEPALLGTGGTVLANRNFFSDRPFLVAHADNLTDFDVANLIARHAARPSGVEITMLAFHTDRPQHSGILELAPDDRVIGFHEKVADPPGTLANGAVYVFEPAVVDAIAAMGKPTVDLSTEIIPSFLGRILAVRHHGYHRDIGTPESLQRARDDVAAGAVIPSTNVTADRRRSSSLLATDALP